MSIVKYFRKMDFKKFFTGFFHSLLPFFADLLPFSFRRNVSFPCKSPFAQKTGGRVHGRLFRLV